MFLKSEADLTVSICWVEGKNDVGTIVVPGSNCQYPFQTAREPDSNVISVISPVPSFEFGVFVEHPFYLPRWIDGFYMLVDVTSEHVKPFLETLKSTAPKTKSVPKTVKALLTDTKGAKEAVQGSRRNKLPSDKPTCDIEGTSCPEVPTFLRLGASRPSRCLAHKMPDMVKIKEVVPVCIGGKKAATVATSNKPVLKEVAFSKQVEEILDGDILTAPHTPEIPNVAGKSCGEIFGKPPTSPVKVFQCNVKTCKKKATYTLETEDDDSIPLLCPEHAKNMPGAYLAKGIL